MSSRLLLLLQHFPLVLFVSCFGPVFTNHVLFSSQYVAIIFMRSSVQLSQEIHDPRQSTERQKTIALQCHYYVLQCLLFVLSLFIFFSVRCSCVFVCESFFFFVHVSNSSFVIRNALYVNTNCFFFVGGLSSVANYTNGEWFSSLPIGMHTAQPIVVAMPYDVVRTSNIYYTELLRAIFQKRMRYTRIKTKRSKAKF